MLGDLTHRLKREPQNQKLWSDWYAAMYPKVMYRAFRDFRDGSVSVEDLVQEAFLKCLDGNLVSSFSSDEHAARYISQMVKNGYFSTFRKERRREQLREEYPNDVSQLHSGQNDLHDDEALPLSVIQASKSLSKEEKALLTALLKGESLGEIAESMGLSYSAVGVRSHRLKEKLRRNLKINVI